MTVLRPSLIIAALFALAACAPVGSAAPDAGMQAPAAVVPYPTEAGRHAMNYVVLTRDGPAEGQARAYVSGLDARRISLSFLSEARSGLWIEATCDGRTRVRPAGYHVTTPAWVPPGQQVQFELGPRERNETLLDLGAEVTQCDLTVTPGGSAPYVLHLLREEIARPAVTRLDTAATACADADGRGADPLSRAFMISGGLSMTCAVPVGATRLLADGVDSLNAKIEALTGRGVSLDALLRGDPHMPLDWSNAPELDLIYVNYLNLNADFAGYLISRMLAWHATRGATVRILVSDVMLTGTDRTLFQGLAAQYPAIQLQPYRFPAEAADGFEEQLARLHRVSHVKLFGTVARAPGRSRVMIGGRNLHEGYFFEEPRDLSAFAFLHQYNPADVRLSGGFTAYEDFEIELRSDAATRSVMQHMATLWHRDFDTQSPRALPVPGGRSAVSEGSVRHFISVPFSDGMAQMGYYERLIDAAQESIRIAVPYLNLPPDLDAALRRARTRGVQVDVVTTVHVREAADFMVTGLNRTFGNDFGDWVNFTDYDPVPRLLHAKLIVIDGRLTVIASTNLNQRSFVHDLENGLVIMDRAIARQITSVIQGYMSSGERVLPGQEVPRFVQRLRRIGFISRAF